MNFLFFAGWWLALLAVPIAALYLLKTRQRRRDVSTLLFWEALRPKVENSPFWRKLRRWLSLLLQLLILLFLVAAIARPSFDWERAAPRHTVAIIDPSASMGAGDTAPTRWADAHSALGLSIARMRVQDEMTLIAATDPPQVLSGWNSSQRALRNALGTSRLLPTGTDPAPALRLAADLTSLRPGSRIVIYSDSVWPPGSWSSPPGQSSVIGVPDGPSVNAGITLFAIRRSPVAPGDWQLDAEVVASSDFSGTLELLRDNQPIDLIPVEAAPDRPWKKSWRGSSPSEAVFEASLKVAGADILVSDNSAACTLPPLATIDILVAGPPDPYLEAALDSIPLVNYWRADSVPAEPPPGTDLIIAWGAAAPQSPPAIPCLLIDPPGDGFWGRRLGAFRQAPVTITNPEPALLRHVGLSSILIESAFAWEPAPGSAVLASTPEGPLIFGRWDRVDARWLVVGFDPSLSDFPLRTAFPIFLANTFQSLRDADGGPAAAALLPGPVESAMVPLASAGARADTPASGGLSMPGWWILAFLAFVLVVGEWWLFHRRLTD